MSAKVDVLVVLDRAVESAGLMVKVTGDLRAVAYQDDLFKARAAVAALIEAAEAYAEAEEALANRELNGMNAAESLDRLQPRVHAARRDLDDALARVRGAA